MPLTQIRQLYPHTLLGLWSITETPAALAQELQEIKPAALTVPEFASINRQQQWLASRILVYKIMAQITPEQPILKNEENGRPYFPDSSLKISLSHTNTTVAVLLSDRYEVGIDIENIRPKVLRVQRKFLAEKELADVGENIEKNLVYWCAKETLFKLYGRGQVLFKEHLAVEPFALAAAGQLSATVNLNAFKKKYCLHYELNPNYALTFGIDTEPDLN